jgi:Protein of unknown function (DUF2938)
MNYLIAMWITGVSATVVMDLWGMLRKILFGIAAPDYRLVGRWVAYLARGRFQHESIAASPPAKRENTIGWTAHYLLGIAYAAVLLAVVGQPWIRQPTLMPALLVGVTTLLVPFFVMQPGMGMGIAASRTTRPWAARLQSLLTHIAFGLGLYAGAWTTKLLLNT